MLERWWQTEQQASYPSYRKLTDNVLFVQEDGQIICNREQMGFLAVGCVSQITQQHFYYSLLVSHLHDVTYCTDGL